MRLLRNTAVIFVLLSASLGLSGCGAFAGLKDWMAELVRWEAETNMSLPSLKPSPDVPTSARFQDVRKAQLPRLARWLEAADLAPGHPVYLRLFKQEAELELWMAEDRQGLGEYRLVKTFDICTFSGALGPKMKEGDRQSPEGFYGVSREALNPNSNYHLSFNLGFPNALDEALGRTGSYLMIHGGCDSIGCYAMTDPVIEVVYTLIYEALVVRPDPVPVHIFPFRRSKENLEQHADSPHAAFWRDLFLADIAFFDAGRPPDVQIDLAARRYKLPAAE